MKNPLELWRAPRGSFFDHPFRDLASFQRSLDNYFEHSGFSPQAASVWKDFAEFRPACDVEETDASYLMSFDLPGLRKEDIKIDLHDNMLSVSGERKEEKKENVKGRQVFERAYGKFERNFTLPQAVSADRVVAEYRDGVLKVTLPKAQASQARQIKVTDTKGGAL